mmetsp:Transcript_13503/g.29526  ORF Transcript_13503/g.29526 Transcript_13503/m.29526 type:complete len:301 (-) Transcript_13503:152-1054(-)
MGRSYKMSWYVNTLLLLVFGAGLSLSMIYGNWIQKTCLLYSMRIGMFSVTMGPGVVSQGLQEVLPEALSQRLGKFDHERVYEFDDMHAFVCQIPAGPWNAPCGLWDNLKTAKWNLLVCWGFGGAILFSAWVMEYIYVNKPKKDTKKIARALYLIGPMLLLFGLAPYFITGQKISSMVPKTSLRVMDRGFWIAATIVMMSPTCYLMQVLFAPRNEDELENEALHYEKKNAREDARNKAWEERHGGGPAANTGYGAMGAPPTMVVGGATVGSPVMAGQAHMVVMSQQGPTAMQPRPAGGPSF